MQMEFGSRKDLVMVCCKETKRKALKIKLVLFSKIFDFFD